MKRNFKLAIGRLRMEFTITFVRKSRLALSPTRRPNLDRSTWADEFRKAIEKEGPAKSLWDDPEGWTWPGYE